ncbi:MAG: hypothetical protein N3D11_10485 [Candidatus Sumerlaeia bacterium]|nr:hypothetical protein [Candidatus Sumerlaeia bacterium]
MVPLPLMWHRRAAQLVNSIVPNTCEVVQHAGTKERRYGAVLQSKTKTPKPAKRIIQIEFVASPFYHAFERWHFGFRVPPKSAREQKPIWAEAFAS